MVYILTPYYMPKSLNDPRNFVLMRTLIQLLFIVTPLLADSQTKEKDAYSLGMEGVQLVDQAQFEEGIKLLKQARNREPGNYEFTYEIGKAYYLSGKAKKAERYLHDLQFHSSVSEDLYILLAKCYAKMELLKKEPNEKRKREMNAYLQGIQKLPKSGKLYCELGKFHLSMDSYQSALGIWELGLKKDPNYAENYYWAARLLEKQGNNMWAWIYGELFLNISDNLELKRAIAPLVMKASELILLSNKNSSPEKVAQTMTGIILEKCPTAVSKTGLKAHIEARKCLVQNWEAYPENIAPIMDMMKEFEKKGWTDDYIASLFSEVDREGFLKWLADDGSDYDQYSKWKYWNNLVLNTSISRND